MNPNDYRCDVEIIDGTDTGPHVGRKRVRINGQDYFTAPGTAITVNSGPETMITNVTLTLCVSSVTFKHRDDVTP